MHYIGIDVAASRPSDIVVLDEDLCEVEASTSADPAATAPEIAEGYPDAVVAVDASRCLAKGLMADDGFRAALDRPPSPGKYRKCRSAEYEVACRSVSIYQTPKCMPE
ncbi:MAG: hypothetical protein GF393_12610, partial [Armatimonadia bacterium]|nr:hypothetical protein [Armatimonadia bacterium]